MASMSVPPAKRRPQPRHEPEVLLRLVVHLLELAGSAPFHFVTVAQAAELLDCDRETVRLHIRRKEIEAYFDSRFLQYAIPLAEMRRLLEERGRAMPDDFATAQTPLALIGGTMTDDPTKKLLPHERHQLEQLLKKLEGSPTANAGGRG